MKFTENIFTFNGREIRNQNSNVMELTGQQNVRFNKKRLKINYQYHTKCIQYKL